MNTCCAPSVPPHASCPHHAASEQLANLVQRCVVLLSSPTKKSRLVAGPHLRAREDHRVLREPRVHCAPGAACHRDGHADVSVVHDTGPTAFLPELHAQADNRHVQPHRGLGRDCYVRAARTQPVSRRTLSGERCALYKHCTVTLLTLRTDAAVSTAANHHIGQNETKLGVKSLHANRKAIGSSRASSSCAR